MRVRLDSHLVGHDYGIDNVDYAIGLKDIGDGHRGGAALFIRDPDGQLLELLPVGYQESLPPKP